MLMKAMKTFRVGSTKKTVHPGDTFETSNGDHYERNGMAFPVRQVATAKPKAAARSGSRTGVKPTTSSSLRQAQAPKTKTSTGSSKAGRAQSSSTKAGG